jgi:uncharacterized protein
VDSALIASAALLGLAGAPHCTAMCSAPCAAAIGPAGWRSSAAFHAARIASYALVGGLAASSVATLAARSELSPALRPVWTLLNAAALVLGAWLLWRGRQPAWLARLGTTPSVVTMKSGTRAQVMRASGRAALAGALWAAWPCGLLQSALIVSALTSGAAAGALAMAAFALASAPGLLAGPWIWRRLSRAGVSGEVRERWAMRAAGGFLAAASAWALARQVSPQFDAFCRTL